LRRNVFQKDQIVAKTGILAREHTPPVSLFCTAAALASLRLVGNTPECTRETAVNAFGAILDLQSQSP